MQFLRIGTGGLRGKIGFGLNPLIAIDFISAFATYTDGGRIIIGRDSRFSSPMLYHAGISALLSCGAEVFDAGICPAPLLQFLVPKMEASGGILIGAGHHPSEWNAIVAVGDDGAYLNSVR
ncbi:MAG: phosphoglucosamine mutase, partial [Candidatus Nanoarchaeia archaeon]